MVENVGSIDRAFRIFGGLALIVLAIGFFPAYQTNWGWIGLVPLVTGLLGTCPAYSVFGINTCSA